MSVIIEMCRTFCMFRHLFTSCLICIFHNIWYRLFASFKETDPINANCDHGHIRWSLNLKIDGLLKKVYQIFCVFRQGWRSYSTETGTYAHWYKENGSWTYKNKKVKKGETYCKQITTPKTDYHEKDNRYKVKDKFGSVNATNVLLLGYSYF